MRYEERGTLTGETAPAALRLGEQLFTLAARTASAKRRVAVVCIGSTRLTGDCFGPLTGHYLKRMGVDVDVHGTLDVPVHAMKLAETIARLDTRNTFVIAVDACVGQERRVGSIVVAPGPLRPGTGLGKRLPELGNVSVSGIAAPDDDPFENLRAAPLGLINTMAEIAAEAIRFTVGRLAETRLA